MTGDSGPVERASVPLARRDALRRAASLVGVAGFGAFAPLPAARTVDAGQQGGAAPGLERWRGGALSPPKLTDLKGQPVDFGHFKGRLIVLNFWATWCVPCRDEMPSLERLHRSFEGRAATVVGVSVGDARMSVQRFIEEHRLSFPILMDEDKSQFKRWKVGILPTTFVIDSRGSARYRHVGERSWDDPAIVAMLTSMIPAKA